MAFFSLAGAVCLAVAAFFFLRLFPIWRQREHGCDAFNILLCAEAIRRDRRVPPQVRDLFILEESEQWYPPVFLALCALLPQDWLQRRYWLFNQVVDAASAILLFLVVARDTDSAWLACGAVVIYAASAGLVLEFAALTTRPLGLLVVNLLMLSAILASREPAWLLVALALGVVLIYAHKLSAQQIWLTAPLLYLLTGDWIWALLVPGIYAAAFIVWPSGFRAVIGAHIAIVRFWSRNWPMLGAHAVRQSPIYGKGKPERRDYYAAWPNGAPLKFAKEVFHQNYFLLPAVVGTAVYLAAGDVGWPHGEAVLPLAAWTASAYVAAALTHFIPALRGLGLGMQYVKFSLFPSICLVMLTLHASAALPVLGATAIAAVLALRQYLLLTKNLRYSQAVSPAGGMSPDLANVLQYLRDDPDARILVLPVHLCDLVAYTTRRPVYWGTHGQCFDDRLEWFFPVLRRPLADFAADGRLTCLLLDRRYAEAAELGIEAAPVMESGPYAIYRLDRAASHADARPGTNRAAALA